LNNLPDALFGGDGFIRLKLPIGVRKLPEESCGISENFLFGACISIGDVTWDFDDTSEHNVKLLVDSIENEFGMSFIGGVGAAGVISTLTSSSPATEGE
jgi:hypothetical protein